ncbi:hypothetical protein D3C77_766960 [compost metagenome]
MLGLVHRIEILMRFQRYVLTNNDGGLMNHCLLQPGSGYAKNEYLHGSDQALRQDTPGP